MSSTESCFSIYLRFYAALSEGREMGSQNFYYIESSPLGGTFETQFNEEQTIAAVMAIDDFKAKRTRMNKGAFLKALEKVVASNET